MHPVFRGGILNFFLLRKSVGVPIIVERAGAQKSGAGVRQFLNCIFPTGCFAIDGRRKRKADWKNFFAVNFQNEIGIDDRFVGEQICDEEKIRVAAQASGVNLNGAAILDHRKSADFGRIASAGRCTSANTSSLVSLARSDNFPF